MSREQLNFLFFILSFIVGFIMLTPINFAAKRNLGKLGVIKLFTILFAPWMDLVGLFKLRLNISYFLLYSKFFIKNDRHKNVLSALYWEPFYQYEDFIPSLKSFRISQELINPEIVKDIDIIMVPNKLILSKMHSNEFDEIATLYSRDILRIIYSLV